MVTGTYTILLNLPEAETLTIGALGTYECSAGYYAYTGSAFGPGGFARVDRHHEIATGDRETRQWHIDYLLGETGARIETVVRSPEADIECAVAQAVAEVGEIPVDTFGASDCNCPSHLSYAPDRNPLLDAVRASHE